MKCKKCKREIADNSIFCNWCGHKQLTASDDVRVPVPRKKGNKFVSQIMVGEERVFISANTEEEYYAKARAAKTEQIEIKNETYQKEKKDYVLKLIYVLEQKYV